MPSRVLWYFVGVGIIHWISSGLGASKQRPHCLQNRLSLMFTSAQSGHFLMAAAFFDKCYLLHDHEQRKKIQAEVKENRFRFFVGFGENKNRHSSLRMTVSRGAGI